MEQKKPRGFSTMSPERRSQVASMGGTAAQRKGTGHKFTSAEAKIAGHLGGLAKRGKGLPK